MKHQYELTIGLEIHTQLKTQSKAFCADPNLFGAEPNTLVSPISLGHPGSMPVFNQKVAELAVRLGLALECTIRNRSFFDRKNYFYPDLPKGYQITQDQSPICKGGQIRYRDKSGQWQTVPLNRIHIEEDAGKLVHTGSDGSSGVDLNRAGVPLLEIVTEPALHSASDAAACLMEVRKLVRYLGVGDGNMEEGSFRCDANISVRKNPSEPLGKKVEIKNMNSFRHVQKSIEFEYNRQVNLLEAGEEVQPETRMFDAEKGQTFALRHKESLNDYRYFPDPDLAPLDLEQSFIDEIQEGMPALPYALFHKYHSELHLPEADAFQLTESRETVLYFEAMLQAGLPPKAAANWINTQVRSWLNEHDSDLSSFPVSPAALSELVLLVLDGKVSHSMAVQTVFPALMENPEADLSDLVNSLHAWVSEDASGLMMEIEKVLNAFPEKVADYRKGKKNLLGLFMGEVRKKLPQADPKVIAQTLENALKG
jgi:aspartyl-tRNA(Asn)/glutamyl-tRNA(Gln) amidotransferase subunit B